MMGRKCGVKLRVDGVEIDDCVDGITCFVDVLLGEKRRRSCARRRGVL